MNKIENEAIKGFKQLRVYDFPIDLYSKHLSIYIGQTMADATKGAEVDYGINLGGSKESNAGYAIKMTSDQGHMLNIILINMGTAKDNDVLVTCAHESLHISWDILDRVGVKIDADNHEAQAYLMHAIFEACKWSVENYIKRYKLKIKP